MLDIEDIVAIFRKWGGSEKNTAFRKSANPGEPIETKIWFHKALIESIDRATKSVHDKYEQITADDWHSLTLKFEKLIQSSENIIYSPSNKHYNLSGLTKSKLANGKWYPAAIYHSNDKYYVRVLCDFEKFILGTPISNENQKVTQR